MHEIYINENVSVGRLQESLKTELSKFMLAYKFAIDEINTKINILKEEFNLLHEYNPIENVKSRIKSTESLINKILRNGVEPTLPSIKKNIRDIAGIRITCAFIADIYRISEMLQNQNDVKVLECKDYINNPKPNGYRSLHLIIEIPVFLSDRVDLMPVEIQIRTIAMDLWASLEHKIYYKYNKEVPINLLRELKEAAITSKELDVKMERIHNEVSVLKEQNKLEGVLVPIYGEQ